MFILNQGQW